MTLWIQLISKSCWIRLKTWYLQLVMINGSTLRLTIWSRWTIRRMTSLRQLIFHWGRVRWGIGRVWRRGHLRRIRISISFLVSLWTIRWCSWVVRGVRSSWISRRTMCSWWIRICIRMSRTISSRRRIRVGWIPIRSSRRSTRRIWRRTRAGASRVCSGLRKCRKGATIHLNSNWRR